MNKVILLGALAMFAGLNAQATKFGVKAGYALSNWNTSQKIEGSGFDAKSGFYAGGLVEHRFTDKMALQVEVEYANLGSQIKVTDGTDHATVKIHQDNIVIPVAAKYYATSDFALLAGPYAAFKASTKTKITGTGLDAGDVKEAESFFETLFDASLKSTQFGLFVGAEYNLPMGVFFDARYSFGLTNMVKSNVGNGDIKTNFLQVGVGYKFK